MYSTVPPIGAECVIDNAEDEDPEEEEENISRKYEAELRSMTQTWRVWGWMMTLADLMSLCAIPSQCM